MYLLMGQAGSGKGTQGEMLAKKLGYDYFSTGHYLRTYMTEERKREILNGKLIDDMEMIEIIRSYLNSLNDKSRTILDGYPRTLKQASWLMENQNQLNIEIEGIVFLDVAEDVLTSRLLARARPDDTFQAIKQRFKEYNTSTAPVIEYFKDHGVKVFDIKGDGSVSQVQNAILKQIGASQ